jgi:hypothetical protein
MTAEDWLVNRPRETAPSRTVSQPSGDEAVRGPEPGRVVARVAGSAPRDAGRANQALTWIGWHLMELAAITVPATLAVTVHPLWTVPAGVAAVAWAANEARVRRHRRTNRHTNRHSNRPDTNGSTNEVRNGLA